MKGIATGDGVDILRGVITARCQSVYRCGGQRLQLDAFAIVAWQIAPERREALTRWRFIVAECRDHQHASRAQAPPQIAQQVERGIVCPMNILQQE